VADRVPASPSSSSTPLASFNYTDPKPFVDPIGEDFFNILLGPLAFVINIQAGDHPEDKKEAISANFVRSHSPEVAHTLSPRAVISG
jgi:hypothetical protein